MKICKNLLFTLLGLLTVLSCTNNNQVVLMDEDFSALEPGMFSSGVIGAHSEYHYLDAVAPEDGWVVSNFSTTQESQRAWRVIEDETGDKLLWQYFTNERNYFHPFVVSGDSLWKDYTISVTLAPESADGLSGFAFRYQNDRCYYFCGVDGNQAILKVVNHATGFHQPKETILDRQELSWSEGDFLGVSVDLDGQQIRAEFPGDIVLEAEDATFSAGRIGLVADIPTTYQQVRVTTTSQEQQQYLARRQQITRELQELQSENPGMVLWKKIRTPGFGVGRNLRFGDLNNDGQLDVLVPQVRHYGPTDSNSEVACMTAMTFDGEMLWQRGEPDRWKDHLTNDVGVQIHDLDNDGSSEVIYCKNFEIVVADGATGETEYSAPTPLNKNTEGRYAKFERILGDCLYFADFRGTGHDSDIVIKDRYRHFWVLNDQLEIMWEGECETGHYPYAYDIDGDNRDELAIGYTLYDDDGSMLWTLDNQVQQHADGVAVVQFQEGEDAPLRILNAASDEGIFFTDTQGNILKHHYFGHVQNPAIANFRDDLPGMEAVSINFWGNQGIITYYDATGEPYFQFEPVQHGSMMLPINWTGQSEEYFVLSADVETGGLFNGWGRKVVEFPADGHPELANAVLDLTGDARDEIVVWDPWEIWVYTQSDNPLTAERLYNPQRNPLYNSSNYQATVSSPGWTE